MGKKEAFLFEIRGLKAVAQIGGGLRAISAGNPICLNRVEKRTRVFATSKENGVSLVTRVSRFPRIS